LDIGIWIYVRINSFIILLNYFNVCLIYLTTIYSNFNDVGTPLRSLRSCRTAAFGKRVS